MTKKTQKLRKVLTLAACAVLLVSVTIVGTVAYLTSQDEVTNTFTVGNVTITLDEGDVYQLDETGGTAENAGQHKDEDTKLPRVDANKYHLIPGREYDKDPTVHVDAESEACWIFVKLENGLKAIIADTTIEKQMENLGWSCIDETNQIYAHKDVQQAGESEVVFNTFKLTDDADVENYANATIKVTAYAVQYDGFSTAQAAWEAAGLN